MAHYLRVLNWRIVSLVATLIIVVLVGVSGSSLSAAGERPSDGFTLHIDAIKHFPGNPDLIAHHFCKLVAGGFYECQLYDSDAPDARLVGVEVVVPADMYAKFSADEKALWHYHKTEIPKVQATLPDLSPEEAAKVVASLQETYGKIYLLWDPAKSNQPIGSPTVYVLDSTQGTTSTETSIWLAALVVVAILAVAAGFLIGRRTKRK